MNPDALQPVSTLEIVLWALGALVFLQVFAGVLAHVLTREDRGGNAEKGIVVFVEPVRWLGIPWGKRTAAAGLRDAGFTGEFLFWRWHADWQGWLVLPALMNRALLDYQANRLAEFIRACKRNRPDRPVYLMGYSCGAYVTIRALELLGDNLRVEGLALLAGAFDPRRDLSPAAAHVAGPVVQSSCILDWFIAGLGPCLFGTADRRHIPSAGMIGLLGHPPAADVTQIRWHPGMIACGHWGSHFSASSRRFVARYIAPAMGIGSNRA